MSGSSSKLPVGRVKTAEPENLSLLADLHRPEEGRSGAVWRQWLSSMATDAEAALAAAMAYRDLDSEARERWLASLKLDAPRVDVPAVALYAPLVAVEDDPERRERMISEMDESVQPSATSPARAFIGRCDEGTLVYVLSTPLYLDFVQVLACGVREGIFTWVRHDPIAFIVQTPSQGDLLEGARLELSPIKSVIDDLAATVLSHRRSGRPLPDALNVLGDLLNTFGP